jgi:hypothetical protein
MGGGEGGVDSVSHGSDERENQKMATGAARKRRTIISTRNDFLGYDAKRRNVLWRKSVAQCVL